MSSPSHSAEIVDQPSKGCCEIYVVDDERVQTAQSALPSDDAIDLAAARFKLIGHPARVKILLALAAEELCVCDLAHVLGSTVSATSHQLRNLRALGMVAFRQEGKLVYYRACDPVMVSLLSEGVAHALPYRSDGEVA